MRATKAQVNLIGLVDSDPEDSDLVSSRVVTHIVRNMPPAKRGRGRPPANKVRKPAAQASTRLANGRMAAAIERDSEREALAEKSRNQQTTAAAKNRKGGVAKDTDPTDESFEIPDSAPAPRGANPGRKPAGRKAVEDVEIPETQQPPVLMELDVQDVSDQIEDLPTVQHSVPMSAQRASKFSIVNATRRLPGGSETEGSDLSLRRRLGELSQRYESLEGKYRDLRDIGVKEAERNFDKLRKQGEERIDDANQLIAKLKAELASQKELAREGQAFKKQLQASEAKVHSLQAQVNELTTSLSGSKTEIKTLSTKLAASRQAEVANAKVPGSAIKSNSGLGRTNVDAGLVTQAAQMKEDLYGDLTGLIVRGVKREGGEDVFDCIQTGRNGTLHFKLSISSNTSGDNYEEAQFLYMPQLDASRDQDLLDTLPDYLVEEITFPRPQAAKFYARVMKSLTERLE